MSLANAFRIARRELRGGLRGFRVFLACLTLGVMAIAAVGSVRSAIEQGLADQGAVILGGDAEIQLTYRFADDAERAWMEENALAVSEITDFRSMAVAGGERALTQVKGVDAAYPLYGTLELDPPLNLDDALRGAEGLPGAVLDPLLKARLGLEIGDRFSLGAQEFAITATLTHEPDGVSAGFSLGPRTLVRNTDLSQSGLLAPGTLFETAYRLKLPPGTDLIALAERAEAELIGSGLRWRDARNGAPGVAEFVDRLGAFLVLVGLAGLAVGGVGVSAAVRAYLAEKTKVIATLKTLGAETRTIFLAYGLQIGALSAVGIGAGLALGAFVPWVLSPIIEARLPVPANFAFHVQPLAEAALYGLLAAAIFTLWPLARTEGVRAAALYRDGSSGLAFPRWPYLVSLALLLWLLLWAASTFSGLARLTLWSAAGLFVAFLTLLIVAWVTRFIANRLACTRLPRGRSAVRMALGSVGGPGSEAGSVILSLGLGLTVLATVGQLDANLRGAIARDLPDVAPSYFVVDIQTDQLQEIITRVTEDHGASAVETAPMLRGVITQINGQPAKDVAGDHWVLEGDRGITYSALPPNGAEITAGAWWPEDYSGPPQVSFAAEEAAEMGLSLGDRLTINVLGRDIEAELTSFRNVDFSTAGIGFILSMNPGALAGAPHTHIATIYADPAQDVAIMRDLGQRFPNLTLIRMRDAIARVTDLLGSIAAATTYGALATLVTGIVVLIGAAAAGERARTYESAILKTLGARRRTILVSFVLRSAIFGLAAGIVAVGAGAVAGWAVVTQVMEASYAFEPISALAIVVGGAIASLLAGSLFSYRALNARPAQVLRNSE